MKLFLCIINSDISGFVQSMSLAVQLCSSFYNNNIVVFFNNYLYLNLILYVIAEIFLDLHIFIYQLRKAVTKKSTPPKKFTFVTRTFLIVTQ